MPLNSVENLPLTLSNIQPASVRSVMSPSSAGGFYPPGRTPLGLGPLEMLQSPASAFSMPPKSAAGKQFDRVPHWTVDNSNVCLLNVTSC